MGHKQCSDNPINCTCCNNCKCGGKNSECCSTSTAVFVPKCDETDDKGEDDKGEDNGEEEPKDDDTKDCVECDRKNERIKHLMTENQTLRRKLRHLEERKQRQRGN